MTRLNAIEMGHGPVQLVFAHGVFGQGRNFGKVAKLLADQTTSVLLDLPNHGRSPWTDSFDFDLFADLVADELRARGAQEAPITLVGHSMGGKVAMRLALRHPELLSRLVVADMSPVARSGNDDFQHLIDSLLSLDLDRLGSRKDADDALAEKIPNTAVRAFLLQNLHRGTSGDGWQWLANLGLLQRSVDKLIDWPPISGQWDGPVLWLRGENSDHVQPGDEPIMRDYFPAADLVTIPDAGHWLHADQPQAVAQAIGEFISRS